MSPETVRHEICPECGADAYNRARGFGDPTVYCTQCPWADRPYRTGAGTIYTPPQVPAYAVARIFPPRKGRYSILAYDQAKGRGFRLTETWV